MNFNLLKFVFDSLTLGGDGWDVSLAMIFSLTPSGGTGHLGDESWKLLRSGEG